MKKIIALAMLVLASSAMAQTAESTYTCQHSATTLQVTFAPVAADQLQAVSLDVSGAGAADGSYTLASKPQCGDNGCVGEVSFVRGSWTVTLGNDVGHRGTYGYVIFDGPQTAKGGTEYLCGQ